MATFTTRPSETLTAVSRRTRRSKTSPRDGCARSAERARTSLRKCSHGRAAVGQGPGRPTVGLNLVLTAHRWSVLTAFPSPAPWWGLCRCPLVPPSGRISRPPLHRWTTRLAVTATVAIILKAVEGDSHAEDPLSSCSAAAYRSAWTPAPRPECRRRDRVRAETRHVHLHRTQAVRPRVSCRHVQRLEHRRDADAPGRRAIRDHPAASPGRAPVQVRRGRRVDHGREGQALPSRRLRREELRRGRRRVVREHGPVEGRRAYLPGRAWAP